MQALRHNPTFGYSAKLQLQIKICRYVQDTGRSQVRSLPTMYSLELRTNLLWPTTRDTYNDDFFDNIVLEPDDDKQLK